MTRLIIVGGDDVRRTAYAAVAARLGGVQLARVTMDEPFAGDFDAVVVMAGTQNRFDLAAHAAQLGKHVLIESPLADSQQTADWFSPKHRDADTLMSAADSIIATCREAGVRLMVGASRRFLPSVQAIRQSLDAGQLGDLGLLRIHRWVPISGGDATECLLDQVDLANWFFNHLPTEIYAASRPNTTTDSCGYQQVHLGFPDGGMALIDVARTLPDGDDYYALSLIGSTGAAYADDHHNTHLLFRGGTASAVCSKPGDEHIAGMLREFAASIEEDREPSVDGSAGHAAVVVADAARRSAESGQALRLDANGDRYEFL